MQASGLLNDSSGPSWYQDLQQKFKEGKFKTYARWGGVGNVVVVIFLSLMFFTSMFPTAIFCCAISVIVGILELPFCCTCLPICQEIQKYMTVFEVYWIRGVLYVGLGVLIFMIYGYFGGFLAIFFAIAYILDGLCYILAHFKGETHSASDNKVESLGVDTNKLKAKAAATAMGIV
mmetsp:Transcript_32305/g.50360  ORF Transcript_32305/g.50360 Transcript_32305/m.50360 type:complete len:176 (+) Transcript_32305:81-608(+)